MAGLTWLHLSDWHQGGSEFDRQVVRGALLKDIQERTKISSSLIKIDFIIFSGDVAFSGKPEEYRAAREQFFQPLLDACKVDPGQLFIVPGNHDLDIGEFKLLPGELLKPLNSEAEVQSWLTDSRARSRLLEPFQAFTSFVRDYTGQEQPDYANVQSWQIGDKKIAVLGLNSAWMCGRNRNADGKINDRGFVLVGEPQIQGHLEEMADADIKIAVLHHPFDWLAEFDCNRIEEHLKQVCNFILRGHQHKPKVDVIHSTSGDYVIIPAGACYNRRIAENPLYANSYNFVHLDFDTGKGIVFLRRWSDPRNKWIEDVDSCDCGKIEFHLFTSTPAASAPSFEPVPLSINIPPRQIPRPPDDFKGREKEIGDIISNYDKEKTINGLYGMPGVGKTALAFVLAERLKDRFPDGQLFLNLKGTSRSPLSSFEAMAQVIHAFHPTDRVPENENELRGRYLSVLADKRVFLLLDNASGSEQVEPLLPSAGCAMLITSRNRFVLPGLKDNDLSILPPNEARELLLEIAPRIGDRAEELAKTCGNLPLALRNAAKALAEKRDLSVVEYERRLRDKKELLALVEASFSLSYDLLTPRRRTQWCRLSVFPEDFDRQGATAVLKMSPQASAEALSDLVKWSLVDHISSSVSKDVRYRLHDLARLFAESRLELDESTDAHLRHAKHYLRVISEAGKLYEKGGENVLQGLELFDREWANIKKGHAWAEAANRGPGKSWKQSDLKSIMDMANSYPIEGANLLDLRLHPQNRIHWHETALATARNMKDLKAEGAHLDRLGSAYSDLGKMHKAIECYSQALKIARKIRCKQGEGADLGNLGNAYYALGQTRKAIEYHEQALAISREIEDRQGEGTDLGNLGNAYSDLGETRKAIDYYEQALAISREIGDRRGEGNRLGNLGLAYSDLGEKRKAIDYYEQALAISREIGDRRSEGTTLGNLGNAYSDLGETRKAIEYYDQALAISREIGDRRGEGITLGNLGSAYFGLGETRKAIEYYEQALTISREIGDRRGEGTALGNLGSTYSDLGETRKAIEYYDQALAISREIEDRRAEGAHLGNLGLAYSDLGEPRKAIDYHEQALAISREIGNRRAEGAHLGNLGNAYSGLGETRKAIDYHEQALAISREIEDRRGEGTALGNLGNAYSGLGETRKAIDYYEQALAIAREIEDRMIEGENLCNLGKAYSYLNETDKAIEHCMQSLDIVRKIEYRKIEGEALCNLGKVYADLGEASRAVDYCDQALGIFQKKEYRRGEGDALFNKSLALDKLGQRQEAIDSAKSTLKIFEQIESPQAEKVRQKLEEWQGPHTQEN